MNQCPAHDTATRSRLGNANLRPQRQLSAAEEDVECSDHADRDAASLEKERIHSTPRWTLLWHARWTVPLHIALPIGLASLIRNDPSTAVNAFWGVHAGFPLVLLASAPWWWSRRDELLVLLLINHLVSFVVLVFVPW